MHFAEFWGEKSAVLVITGVSGGNFQRELKLTFFWFDIPRQQKPPGGRHCSVSKIHLSHSRESPDSLLLPCQLSIIIPFNQYHFKAGVTIAQALVSPRALCRDQSLLTAGFGGLLMHGAISELWLISLTRPHQRCSRTHELVPSPSQTHCWSLCLL